MRGTAQGHVGFEINRPRIVASKKLGERVFNACVALLFFAPLRKCTNMDPPEQHALPIFWALVRGVAHAAW